jgi:hypothetical protein
MARARAKKRAITADDLLGLIVNDLFRFKYSWGTFRCLYVNDTKNVDILNAAGSGFFVWVHDLIVDDVLLRISRLTDPATNNNQKNASLEGLLVATGWDTTDAARATAFRGRIDAVRASCDSCRKHRNKRISHTDQHVSLKIARLPDVTVRTIDEAIASIEAFVVEISSALQGMDQSFTLLDGDGDVKRLLEYLTNRASSRNPGSVSRINYTPGGGRAELVCAFCGERSDLPFFRNDKGSPFLRSHFAKCYGVVGCESIKVEAVDVTGNEGPRRFDFDLRSR